MSIERAREPKDLKFVIVWHKPTSRRFAPRRCASGRGGCKNATRPV